MNVDYKKGYETAGRQLASLQDEVETLSAALESANEEIDTLKEMIKKAKGK